jgi:phytoene desaturase
VTPDTPVHGDVDSPVVVIGAGIGGLCLAVRLALAGLRPVVLEGSSRIGGRLATDELDGFRMSSGALALAHGDTLEDTFDLAGVPYELVTPEPSVAIRSGEEDITAPGGIWRDLAQADPAGIGRLTAALRTAGLPGSEGAELTVQEWVAQYTSDPTAHGLFHSMCITMFTANHDQVPISELGEIIRRTGGFKDFGFVPAGASDLVAGLASVVESHGGTIRLDAPVTRILVRDGRAVGVEVTAADGTTETVSARAVVSNAGPQRTAALVEPGPWTAALDERVRDLQPCTLFALYFATTYEVSPHPGIWTFTDFERVCSMGTISTACPEWAPPGWHLYFANSVPPTSRLDDFDEDEEFALMVADLRRFAPDLFTDERSRVVRFRTYTGLDTPAHRVLPGTEVSTTTPVPGLYDVGDGAKPVGWVGTSGSAESARLVAEELLAEQLVTR